LLEPYKGRTSADEEQLQLPIEIDREEEYEVEKILGERKSKGVEQYLVKWLN